jgi:hypothetical protein
MVATLVARNANETVVAPMFGSYFPFKILTNLRDLLVYLLSFATLTSVTLMLLWNARES